MRSAESWNSRFNKESPTTITNTLLHLKYAIYEDEHGDEFLLSDSNPIYEILSRLLKIAQDFQFDRLIENDDLKRLQHVIEIIKPHVSSKWAKGTTDKIRN